MTVLQGVIVTSTGHLIRAGYVDFTLLPDFDAGTESVRTDVPDPPFVKAFFNGIFDSGDPDYDTFHRWNGSAWVTVPSNIGDLSKQAFNYIKSLNDVQLTYTVDDLTKVEYYEDETLVVKLYTKVMTYNGSGDLTTAVLTREADGAVFTLTLTYTGDNVTGVTYS